MNFGSPPPQAAWPPSPVGNSRGRRFLGPLGICLALLISIAALVVSLLRDGGSSVHTIETQIAVPEPTQLFVDGPDRELCEAMGPLMNEHLAARKAFLASGQQNSPERKAAIPEFVEETYEWARRAQETLDQHNEPPRFLPRNYQRFIDDSIMYAEQLSPDRDSSIFENQLYDFGTIDLAGLIGRCSEVDVLWWK